MRRVGRRAGLQPADRLRHHPRVPLPTPARLSLANHREAAAERARRRLAHRRPLVAHRDEHVLADGAHVDVHERRRVLGELGELEARRQPVAAARLLLVEGAGVAAVAAEPLETAPQLELDALGRQAPARARGCPSTRDAACSTPPFSQQRLPQQRRHLVDRRRELLRVLAELLKREALDERRRLGRDEVGNFVHGRLSDFAPRWSVGRISVEPPARERRGGGGDAATRAARAAAERQFSSADGRAGPRALPATARPRHRAHGLTCRTLCNAAKLALKLRPYSSEVVTLAGHEQLLLSVAVTPGGLIITGSEDGTQAFAHPASVKVWRDGICVRTIQSNAAVAAVAALPCGSSFLSGTDDQFLRRWSLDGALEWEEDMGVGDAVTSIAVLCDGVHAVVGFGTFTDDDDDKGGAIRLYNVDGTLVHTFTGHISWVDAVAVTPDGQHIISGSVDLLVKVERRQQEPSEHLRRAHPPRRAVAAMPDGQRILSGWTTPPSACGFSTAPSRTPSS